MARTDGAGGKRRNGSVHLRRREARDDTVAAQEPERVVGTGLRQIVTPRVVRT